ncbi:cell division topological specificity factor MinE [Telmatospirillum sp. J64-1]|uniref:cell division topological specificity factor MinE n=1 Tax=Telmatospirillum sp. J64-1 TaxID=2502183 RepID=UPI00115D7ED2|nr:cell division topological specificity factor MinE [Telmatospirillum sp. J64-1]
MNIRNLFRSAKPKTAEKARDRLKILLAHERSGRNEAIEFLPQLQREIIEVIRKYVAIDDERVAVRVEREEDISLLEVNIELPGPPGR